MADQGRIKFILYVQQVDEDEMNLLIFDDLSRIMTLFMINLSNNSNTNSFNNNHNSQLCTETKDDNKQIKA